MSAQYRVDEGQDALVIEVTDEVSLEGWQALSERLEADPRALAASKLLIDMRLVRRVDIGAARLRAFAATDPYGQGRRRAIVTSTSWLFGMARMYGLVARLPEGSYGVFKDRDEACAWLGIDARRLASAHGTTRTRSTVG